MVRSHQWRQVGERGESAHQVSGDDRVGHHQRPLFGVEPAPLAEEAVRQAELPQVLEKGGITHPPAPRRFEPEMPGKLFGERRVFAGPAVQGFPELDCARQRQHRRLLHPPGLLEQAGGFQGRGGLVRKRHHGGQISLPQPRTQDGDGADRPAGGSQRRGDHGVEMEHLAQPTRVRRHVRP